MVQFPTLRAENDVFPVILSVSEESKKKERFFVAALLRMTMERFGGFISGKAVLWRHAEKARIGMIRAFIALGKTGT